MQINDLIHYGGLLTQSNTLIKTKEPSDQQIQARLEKIKMKLKAGKKLSASEMEFLKQHDEALYQTAQRVESERQQLESRLAACKTKEDAQDVMSSALDGINSKDPDAEYISAAFLDVIKNFQEKENYQALSGSDKDEKNGKTKKRENDEDEDISVSGIYGKTGEFIAWEE